MDGLKEICDRQIEFMVRVGLFKNRESEIANAAIALMLEATEVLNEVNWKPWKKHQKEVNEQALKEEIIDCLHFVIELALLVDMNALDILEEYKKKMVVNIARQKGGY